MSTLVKEFSDDGMAVGYWDGTVIMKLIVEPTAEGMAASVQLNKTLSAQIGGRVDCLIMLEPGCKVISPEMRSAMSVEARAANKRTRRTAVVIPSSGFWTSVIHSAMAAMRLLGLGDLLFRSFPTPELAAVWIGEGREVGPEWGRGLVTAAEALSLE